MITVVVLSIAIVGSSLYGIFSYKKNRVFTDEYNISKDEYDVSHIEIYNRVDNIDVNFLFLPPNSDNILEAYLNATVLSSTFLDPLEISISKVKTGDILNITILSSNDENDYISNIRKWNYTIMISSDYSSYVFDSKTKDGDIFLDANGDFEFSSFKVSTRAGEFTGFLNQTAFSSNIDLSSDSGHMRVFIDRTNIFGKIIFTSESANLDLNLWDVIFTDPSSINLTSNVGALVLLWAQHVKYNNSVDISLQTNFYSKVKFWCLYEFIRLDVKMESDMKIGFVPLYSPYFTKIDENHYQNTNYADENSDYFRFRVSGAFESEARFVNCFKPVRYEISGGYWGSLKRFRNVSGEYKIEQSNFNVTSIKFTHKAISHFDIPSNLTVNFGTLSSSSDLLVNATWNLTCAFGGNAGFGQLTPKFNFTVIGSILYLDLLLDFDETKIYPVFTDGSLLVNFHPSLGIVE